MMYIYIHIYVMEGRNWLIKLLVTGSEIFAENTIFRHSVEKIV